MAEPRLSKEIERGGNSVLIRCRLATGGAVNVGLQPMQQVPEAVDVMMEEQSPEGLTALWRMYGATRRDGSIGTAMLTQTY